LFPFSKRSCSKSSRQKIFTTRCPCMLS
jgi:hypothetical protein